MATRWTPQAVLELAPPFQPPCILAAAADLEIFPILAKKPRTAAEVARHTHADLRGITLLLDALTALQLLIKTKNTYRPAPGIAAALSPDHPASVLAMVQHQANCLRRWADLAATIRAGTPRDHAPSVRGQSKDHAAFIQAMDDLSRRTAPDLIAELARQIPYRHVLDVGGASGTWTIAFLHANPQAAATLFDLPTVIPMAQARLKKSPDGKRVRLVAGDFTTDPLPPGADLAWVSAIIHQQSRAENRALYQKIFAALVPGGRILIRDVVMDPTHTRPPAALFAINMLSATATGTTFTLAEIRADLTAAGFHKVRQLRKDPWMNSLVIAEK